MADEVRSAFKQAWPLGPGSAPAEPRKEDIWNAGGVIDAIIDAIRSIISVGSQQKAPVRLLISTAVPLSSLTAGATMQGVTLASGNRLGLIAQSNGAENGIWVVQASGSPARASDADSPSEALGMAFYVSEGDSAGKVYVCNTPAPITIGTTPLTFVLLLDTSSLNGTISNILGYLGSPRQSASAGSPLPEMAVDTGWLWRLGTRYGASALGLDFNGVLHALLKYASGVPSLTDGLAAYQLTESGKILCGVDWDGRHLSAGEVARDIDLFAAPVAGNSKVLAVSSGKVTPLNFGDENGLQPARRGAFARYLAPVSDGYAVIDEEVVAKTALLPSVNVLRHSAVYGQSLSLGDQTGSAQSSSPVVPGRVQMFNGGAIVNGRREAERGIKTNPERLYALTDSFEVLQESPASQIGYELARVGGLAATDGILVSGHGVGGQPYDALKRGTQPYENLIAAVRRGRIIAGLNGLAYATPNLHWIHGENNLNDSLATYLAHLQELRANLQEDIAPFMETAGEVVLFLDQISNWTHYDNKPTTSQVPLAQLQAYKLDPAHFVCVCPKYFLPSSDGTHLTAASSAILGAYHGRAERQFLLGTYAGPLRIGSAIRTGPNIVINYVGGSGDVALDAAAVSNPGNYGFEWRQTGGAARTITSATKTGARQITVALSGDPGAPSSQQIGYALTGISGNNAGPTTGPRGCVRDSATDQTSTGYVMRNWACHDLVTVN